MKTSEQDVSKAEDSSDKEVRKDLSNNLKGMSSNKKRRQRDRNDRYDKIHSQKKNKVLEEATDSTSFGSKARYQRKRRLEMKKQQEIKQDQIEGCTESINPRMKVIRKNNSMNRYITKKRIEEKKRSGEQHQINRNECIGQKTSNDRYMQRKRAEQKMQSRMQNDKQPQNVGIEAMSNQEIEVRQRRI